MHLKKNNWLISVKFCLSRRQTHLGFVNGSENTSRLDNIFSSGSRPLDIGWVLPGHIENIKFTVTVCSISCSLLEHGDSVGLLASGGDDQFSSLSFHGSFEAIVGGVILEHVDLQVNA